MNDKMIRTQSESALKQWGVQWAANAKEHSKYFMKSLSDLENTGVGKAVLCVANGYSYEENIETIKKFKGNVDIVACDKTMGTLIDNGIIPQYVIMCDANVDYELYCENYKDKLSNTILLANVCGNPKWASGANWKSKYFFINKDILESEKTFSEISGCTNFIPAGTNVSNAMVVMLTQCDNSGRRNYFGYDKILLIGYDYSWRFGGKYYSFNETGDGKDKYMCHIYTNTTDGSFAYTSGNLHFSAQWLETYVKTFNLPVIQCTGKSILGKLKIANLEEQICYRYKPQDSLHLRKAVRDLRHLISEKKRLENKISTIASDHWNAFLCSV